MKNQLIIEMLFNCPCTQLTRIFCLICNLNIIWIYNSINSYTKYIKQHTTVIYSHFSIMIENPSNNVYFHLFHLFFRFCVNLVSFHSNSYIQFCRDIIFLFFFLITTLEHAPFENTLQTLRTIKFLLI